MTVTPQGGGLPVGGGGRSGNLYDVLDLVLDRGLVIDVFARVSLVGIEILKVDARVVVASVDTYLRFAEACNRLDLESGRKAPAQLPDMVQGAVEGGAKSKSKGVLTGAVEAITDSLHKDDDEDAERERVPREAPHRGEAERRPRRSSRPREE
ncbi:gas vesicle structural protein GvpA [Streptomyces cinnamoneus]|uniref:gas vesicle structural protein GvpA n=1 Tax=Streptomyces cinnamoneus TaxID=53446 RepID=UPI0034274F45